MFPKPSFFLDLIVLGQKFKLRQKKTADTGEGTKCPKTVTTSTYTKSSERASKSAWFSFWAANGKQNLVLVPPLEIHLAPPYPLPWVITAEIKDRSSSWHIGSAIVKNRLHPRSGKMKMSEVELSYDRDRGKIRLKRAELNRNRSTEEDSKRRRPKKKKTKRNQDVKKTRYSEDVGS